MSIGFFQDFGLSQPATRLLATAASDGAGSSDHLFYFGGTDVSREHVAESDPGVDNVVISIADSSGGTLLLPSALKLAVAQVDLDTATPGASLSVGTNIIGGAANAIPVWVRVDAPAIAAMIYNNLTLTTNALLSREIA